jgi:hypothetical protein
MESHPTKDSIKAKLTINRSGFRSRIPAAPRFRPDGLGCVVPAMFWFPSRRDQILRMIAPAGALLLDL